MPSPVEIPRELVNQILHHAQATPEWEVCGLLGAKGGIPCSWYPVANADTRPQSRFQLDSAGQIAAMRQIRERGEGLFAIVHSHPAAPAEPSPADLSESEYTDTLYLIVSLNTKGVLEMRGFWLAEDKTAQEITLLLKADTAS